MKTALSQFVRFALVLVAPLLAAPLLATPCSQAAELMLRSQATPSGSLVRLGDLADLGAASPLELRELADTPLLPTPAPGTEQFLSAAQIRDLLVAQGFAAGSLHLNGAPVVQIGSAEATAAPQRALSTTSLAEQVQQRVQQAIEAYLLDATTADRWEVEVTLTEQQVAPLSSLGAMQVAPSQAVPRAGKQRFSLTGTQHDQTMAVYATATPYYTVVVARQPIQRDQTIRAHQVMTIEQAGNLPSQAATQLEQVVGQVALRSLRVDQVLSTNQLRAAWQVHRGESIQVFVRTGGITVRTAAVAKENGALGQLISVETAGDKRQLEVSVSGPGQATRFATGGQATDYASLPHKNPSPRFRR
jgi:flagella basal body P-ring formation protein FlgA